MNRLMKMYYQMLTPREGEDRGATMVEYGLMVALIAVVAMVGAAALGVSVFDIFDTTADQIAPTAPAGG